MLDKSLDQFRVEHDAWETEGYAGYKNLTKIVKAIGYDYDRESLVEFLCDNSGAIEAIITWIKDTNLSEWDDCIKDNLTE